MAASDKNKLNAIKNPLTKNIVVLMPAITRIHTASAMESVTKQNPAENTDFIPKLL